MKHYNPTIAEDATRIFNLKNGDMMPEEIGEPVAVIPIIRQNDLTKTLNTAASGTTTIFTTDASKDTYITAFLIAYNKNAACAIGDGAMALTATINGVATVIGGIPHLDITAERQIISVTLPYPMKVDRNTAVTLSGTFGAGACRRLATIYGYTVETTKGV